MFLASLKTSTEDQRTARAEVVRFLDLPLSGAVLTLSDFSLCAILQAQAACRRVLLQYSFSFDSRRGRCSGDFSVAY